VSETSAGRFDEPDDKRRTTKVRPLRQELPPILPEERPATQPLRMPWLSIFGIGGAAIWFLLFGVYLAGYYGAEQLLASPPERLIGFLIVAVLPPLFMALLVLLARHAYRISAPASFRSWPRSSCAPK
jgi:hypothetical protein